MLLDTSSASLKLVSKYSLNCPKIVPEIFYSELFSLWHTKYFTLKKSKNCFFKSGLVLGERKDGLIQVCGRLAVDGDGVGCRVRLKFAAEGSA